MISCCPLKNIGTKLVLKYLLRAPMRNHNESEYPPRTQLFTIAHSTGSCYFLRYRVFPSSDGLGQSSSRQQ